MERKQITFDTFVRGVLAVIVVVGIVMLLNRLSGVLVPFFLAWLLAYLLFPLVKFFQYRCRLKYRILAILLSFVVAGSVAAGVFMLMVPPMISEGSRVADLIIRYVQTDETMSNIPRMVQQFVHDNVDIEQLKKLVTQDGFIDMVKSTLPKVWDVISQSISIVSSVFSLTMVALYTLFILLDYEEMTGGWAGLLPRRYRPFAKRLVSDVTEGMNKYFRG
ncbi:MAG: AI-2E family transporter, partial [Prevotella sp.]|nr:AI-2E family transporter [Prevotella sp.]